MRQNIESWKKVRLKICLNHLSPQRASISKKLGNRRILLCFGVQILAIVSFCAVREIGPENSDFFMYCSGDKGSGEAFQLEPDC